MVGHVKDPSVSALWRWQNLPQVRHKGIEKSSCGPFTSIDSVGEDVTIAFCPLPHVCCLKTASLQRSLSYWDSLSLPPSTTCKNPTIPFNCI